MNCEPLKKAIRNKHFKVAKILMMQPNIKIPYNYCVLEELYNYLPDAKNKCDLELLELIRIYLEKKDAIIFPDRFQQYLKKRNQYPELIQQMKNHPQFDICPCLSFLCKNKENNDLAKEAIEKGAIKRGYSPRVLYNAVESCNEEMVEILLQFEEVRFLINQNITCQPYCAQNTVLSIACAKCKNNLKIVEMLLKLPNIDLFLGDEDSLVSAAKNKNYQIVGLLTQHPSMIEKLNKST
jgi:hypothetical protein